MIIISQAQTQSVQIRTPWGIEPAVSFMNQFFVPTHSFRKLESAIRTCRQDLEAGLFSIVVQSREQAQVCCPLPREIAQVVS